MTNNSKDVDERVKMLRAVLEQFASGNERLDALAEIGLCRGCGELDSQGCQCENLVSTFETLMRDVLGKQAR